MFKRAEWNYPGEIIKRKFKRRRQRDTDTIKRFEVTFGERESFREKW